MSGTLLAVTGTAGLVVASWALAAEQMAPPKSDLPKSPEQYITITSTKPPVVQRPHIDQSQPQPDPQTFYTAEMRQAGLEGNVVVDVFVLADGTAGVMKINKSSGQEPLDNAAKAVVERMRFVPGTLNGTPSPMWAHLAFGFKLEEPSSEAPK
jgi:protein TonB